MLLFDSSLWFGTSQEVLHGGGKWLDNKERLGLGGKHNWITSRKSFTGGNMIG